MDYMQNTESSLLEDRLIEDDIFPFEMVDKLTVQMVNSGREEDYDTLSVNDSGKISVDVRNEPDGNVFDIVRGMARFHPKFLDYSLRCFKNPKEIDEIIESYIDALAIDILDNCPGIMKKISGMLQDAEKDYLESLGISRDFKYN